MRPLTLARAGSSRELPAYAVLPRTHEVARVSERDTGSAFPRGDALPLPTELVVTVFMPAVAFTTAVDTAHEVIADAELAVTAVTHEGRYDIAGFAGYDMRPDERAVLLTLRFLATGPHPLRTVRAQPGRMSATSHAATIEATEVTTGGVTYASEVVTYGGATVSYTA